MRNVLYWSCLFLGEDSHGKTSIQPNQSNLCNNPMKKFKHDGILRLFGRQQPIEDLFL